MLTHASLRGKVAEGFAAKRGDAEDTDDLLGDAALDLDDEFAAYALASLRGLIPTGDDDRLSAMERTFPESVDRETVVFIIGSGAGMLRVAAGDVIGMGVTLARVKGGWQVAGVDPRWTVPAWVVESEEKASAGM